MFVLRAIRELNLKVCLIITSALLLALAILKLIDGALSSITRISLIAGILLAIVAVGTIYATVYVDLAIMNGLMLVYGLLCVFSFVFFVISLSVQGSKAFTLAALPNLIGVTLTILILALQTTLIKLFMRQHRVVDIMVMEVT